MREVTVDESQRENTDKLQAVGSERAEEITPWIMRDDFRQVQDGSPQTGAGFAGRVARGSGKKLQ